MKKHHLMTGNYYYNVYTKSYPKFILGYKTRKYVDPDSDSGWAWSTWPYFQIINCKKCIRRLLGTAGNQKEIADTIRSPEGEIACLSWGKNFTPETWLLYPPLNA